MEKPLKCAKLLSLKDIVLRRVVIHFWNGSDMVNSILKFKSKVESGENWPAAEDEIKDKILKLRIPESLSKEMVDLVKPIGVGIRDWRYFHVESFNLACIEGDSVKLYFTSEGTVDERKTAEELVRCGNINVVHRYHIACAYWLEDSIPLLWGELTEEDKDYFYRKNPALQGLQFSWPRIFNGRESNLDWFLRSTDRNLTSFNQWAFEHSVKMCYKTTARHFFQKLSHEEREASVMRCAHSAFFNTETFQRGRLYDVFCYLLSLMTPKQQMEIVKACPLGVLSCFLDWPRRDLFLEVVDFVWPFLPPKVYGDLLHKVICRHDKNYFPKFFPDFYKRSPLEFKNHFICYGEGGHNFLPKFLSTEDSESIKVMFRSMDAEDRTRLVFQCFILQAFHSCILRDKGHLVELCLREAALSAEDRRRLKATFLGHLEAGFMPLHLRAVLGPRRGTLRRNPRDAKLKSFYDFLDKTDASVEKTEED